MTCENYTCNNANAVEREQERKLTVKNKEEFWPHLYKGSYPPFKKDGF